MDSCIIRELENEEDVIGVPVCGANLMSPVYDRTKHHWRGSLQNRN
jgi:hypothetical protein